MSSSEFWAGNIKEMKFPKDFTKEQIADFLTINDYPAIVEDDRVMEEDYEKNPIFDINGRIFVSVDLKSYDSDSFSQIKDNCDGSYNIIASFYNGGTCLREVVERLITKKGI